MAGGSAAQMGQGFLTWPFSSLEVKLVQHRTIASNFQVEHQKGNLSYRSALKAQLSFEPKESTTHNTSLVTELEPFDTMLPLMP